MGSRSSVRRLLPPPPAADVDLEADLDEAYWVPDPGRQHVAGVMVASADGATTASGRAGGLSGPADKRLFALLRSHAEVLLVGASTARAERYGGERPAPDRLRWRRAHGLTDAPTIAVVTRSCALDPAGPLFTDTAVRPILVTCRVAPAERVAALADLADVLVAGDRDVDVAVALDALADRGLRRVSCEGGPTLLAQLVAAGRLDELCLTVSPLLLAGPALRLLNGPALSPATRLGLRQVLAEDGFLFLRYTVDR